MNSAAKKLYTVDDYRATPDGPPWIQLIEGELVMDPSPAVGHQKITLRLAMLLARHAQARRLGEVFVAPLDVYLSEHNVFQPDVFFVSFKRAAITADDGIYGAPDLAVEILSPSSRHRDRVQKLRVYRTAGVKEFWLVDPLAETVQVFDFTRDANHPVKTLSGKSGFISSLFPGLKITAEKIFVR